MELQKVRFSVGQMVYGKLTGHIHWPALITEIDKNIAKIVYFNANQQYSYLSFNKLTPYHAGRKIVEKYYGHHKKFSKAYDEMEIVLKLKLKEQNEKEIKKGKKMEKKTKMKRKNATPKKIKMKEITKHPVVILQRLGPMEIERMKRELKEEKLEQKPSKSERKLRSGRKF